MTKNKLFKKIYLLVNTINIEPLTFKKAVLLCFFIEGFYYAADFILWYVFKIYFNLLPQIIYLITILIAVRWMDKDELSRILTWRNITLPVFASLLILFFGWEIIKSEVRNFFDILLPIPDGFLGKGSFIPKSVFYVIVSTALFPGFSEEIFFRGIIARRFFNNYSPQKAIVLSAALFGIFHLNPWQAVGAFCGGLLYGWMYWRFKSIWLCMFCHAYHNVLVSFISAPYTNIKNKEFLELWHHPLWFDIMGLLLFGFGLLSVIVLSRKEKTVREDNET